MAKTCFSVIDIAITAISLCSFIADVGTDLAVCVQFLQSGLVLWAWMTLALTLIPSLIMNVFSLAWHIQDKTVTPLVVAFHLMLMAPVQRYFNVLRLGVKSRKSRKVVYSQRAWRARNDVSILRLFEAFMESAPQLVLQLSILVHFGRLNWFTGLSIGASFLSLSWALTAYSDSLRRACKSGYQRRLTGLLLHWGWQLFMSLSRISAFVVFAYVLHKWVFVVMATHWVLSFLWICVQGTDFGNGLCEKWMFRGVCAFIYIFVFLNLSDGKSRYRITAFYIVMLMENTAMVTVYSLMSGGNHVLAAVTVFAAFFLGLLCMLVYYGFLHPTKTPALKSEVFKLSRSKPIVSPHASRASSASQGQIPIFSIDSPQSNSVMDGTSINLSLPTNSHSLPSDRKQNNAFTVPLPQLDQTLKHTWASGMDSSCTSSSSSLASDLVEGKKGERPASRASENSNDSERSNNCLLSVSKNNLSKSSSPPSKNKQFQPLDKSASDDPSFTSDLNVMGSDSPSLSRCSWARSSDRTRQSLGAEEFVTLGFDCSSSIERRVSESSSLNSRPKSLSPLNVSNLWQDARSKLRQTIAATIAAATCNPSSNEGTPNRSQSFMSHTNSSQDESSSSLSHNFGFMDSKSSYHERDRDQAASAGSGSLNSGRNREALSSLPDIFETAEHEQLSDTSYDVSVKKSPYSNAASPWFNLEESLKNKGTRSPYLEDSTLTASKLGDLAITPTSFLSAQNKLQSTKDSLNSKGSTNSVSSKSESCKKKHSPGGSPFTDQELASVMAKSLQSYIGAGSSTDSTNKEREGLALTLEDLQYPIDLDEANDPASTSHNLQDSMTKSRSTSSLFHDGDDSSPASSASKMQRVADLKKADSEISPNALKHLNLSSSSMLHQADSPVGNLKLIDTLRSQVVDPSNCDALKILMEAYGQLSTRSPLIRTPDSSKLSVHREVSDCGTHTPRQRNHTLSQNFHHESSDLGGKNLRFNPDLKVFKDIISEGRDIRKRPSVSSRNNIDLFDSIAWQKSKLKAKQRSNENSQAYAGQSSTKRLHVQSQNHVFELHNSPSHNRNCKSSPEDNETVNYVEGKYRPPLYKLSNEKDSILNNLNQSQSNSYKSKSPKKDISTNSFLTSSVTRHSSSDLPRSSSSNLQRSLMQQEPDYFHLHAKDYKTGKMEVGSRYNSSTHGQSELYLNDSWDINDARLVDSPLSYSRHQRSTSLRESGGQRESFHLPQAEHELKMSAKHVEDYFSQALRYAPDTKTRPRKTISHSDLGIHSTREPLKPVQNSPHHSPRVHFSPMAQSQQFRKEHFSGRKRSQSGNNDKDYSKDTRRLSLDSKFI